MIKALRIKTIQVKAPKVGDKMRDGSVYCGVSPHTGYPFYVASEDIPGAFTWLDAKNYAWRRDQRIPTLEELQIIYAFKNVIGDFKPCMYWASAPHYLSACWGIDFKTGTPKMSNKGHMNLMRCVFGYDPNIQ